MDYSTPILDRLAFNGEALSSLEKNINNLDCKIFTFEPYLVNDGDGAIITIFDFGIRIHGNQYFAIEKSKHYKYFLIGFSIFKDGSSTTNISALQNNNLDEAAEILKEYIQTNDRGEKWEIRGL